MLSSRKQTVCPHPAKKYTSITNIRQYTIFTKAVSGSRWAFGKKPLKQGASDFLIDSTPGLEANGAKITVSSNEAQMECSLLDYVAASDVCPVALSLSFWNLYFLERQLERKIKTTSLWPIHSGPDSVTFQP